MQGGGGVWWLANLRPIARWLGGCHHPSPELQTVLKSAIDCKNSQAQAALVSMNKGQFPLASAA